MQVNWLHPWLLFGTLASSLPIVIHLIGRRRAPKVSFAAFDFLMAVNKRLARRERLRHFLLLLLRTLAVLALVFAVGRPMPNRALAETEVGRRITVVFDASGSMGYRSEGETLLELGKKKVLEVVSHLSAGDQIGLVVAGEEIEAPISSLTVDHGLFRKQLEKISLSRGATDLGAAVERGLAQLGESGEGATLMIVSDLAKNSFDNLRPVALDPFPQLHVVDVMERESAVPLLNVAVESILVESSRLSPLDRVVKVTLRNFGVTELVEQELELLINGEVRQRGYVDLGPLEVVEKSMTLSFEEPGVYRGSVRLVGDSENGFSADDQGYFVVEAAQGVRVLAVNGDPRTTPYEDELFFLERALEVLPEGESPIDLDIITSGELASSSTYEKLKTRSVEVLVLANVREVPPEAVEHISGFVEAGGGLLLTLGDRISFEGSNEQLESLLPHPLRDFHQAFDPISGSPALGMGEFDWDHPVLRGLGRSFEESLRASRTMGYFNLATGAVSRARSVMAFDNGAPALVERIAPGGRVLLLTTSIDLDSSDLVLRSAFPAFLQRACRYLGKGALEVSGTSVTVDEEAVVPIPTGVTQVALISPAGERRVEVVDPALTQLKLASLDEIGIYRVEVLRKAWEPMPQLDIAVNPALAESDFQPIRHEDLLAKLSGGDSEALLSLSSGQSSSGDPFAARGYASYFLLALSFLFVGECLLASRG